MALIFSESFDSISSGTLLARWSSWASGLGGNINGSGGRRNSGALVLGQSSQLISRSFVTTGNEFYIGFAIKIGAWGTGAHYIYCENFGGGYNCALVFDSNSTRLYRGNESGVLLGSTSPLSLSTWYYVEFGGILDNSAGSLSVRINEQEVISYFGDTTSNATICGRILFNGAGTNSGANYDDIYWCDGSGDINNTFLGDIRVDSLLPNGAGNYTQWIPSTGSNWECVNDSTPNTTDYVSINVSGYKDSYVFENAPIISGKIFGITVLPYMQKYGIGYKQITPFIRTNSTDYNLSLEYLGGGYIYYPQVIEINPDTTNNWTVSEINNLEAGIKSEG